MDFLEKMGQAFNEARAFSSTEQGKFYTAIKEGDLNTVISFIEKDPSIVNISAKVLHDATPLMIAADRGHENIVHLLVTKGANMNAKDSDGKTAMLRAAKAGYLRTAADFINKGADSSVQDKQGQTVVMYAQKHGYGEEFISLILLRGLSNGLARKNDGPAQ